MLGTSGQQHLHQQHLQQQQAAAACAANTSQLASPIAAKSHHHISVSRAHSFPKTSPLAMASDYQARTGNQGTSGRTANVAVTHGRSTNNGSSSSSSQSPSQKISSGASHSAQSSKSSRGTSASSSQSAASPSSLVQAQEKAGRRSPSHTHTHSPRTTRKANAERVTKHAAAISGMATGRDPAVPPPVAARSSSKQQPQSPSSNPSRSTHSMLTTNHTITPPNKVVGATVDELPLGAVSQLPSHRDREHPDRRDKV